MACIKKVLQSFHPVAGRFVHRYDVLSLSLLSKTNTGERLHSKGFSTSATSFIRNQPNRVHRSSVSASAPLPVDCSATTDTSFAQGVLTNINEQIANRTHGRLFAVIHMSGLQFKITTDDLVQLRTNSMFADVGERICLEKILLVGSKDFTLVGRPLLSNVRIEATVIEKTLSHQKTWFFYKKRKNVRKLNLIQEFLTVIRINSIEMVELEDEVD